MVVDAVELKSAKLRIPCAFRSCAHAGLKREKLRTYLEVFCNRIRGRESVLAPPLRGSLQVSESARRDIDLKQGSDAAQLPECFGERDGLTARGFCQRQVEFSFQFGWDVESLVNFAGKNRDGHALRKRLTVEDNLAFNYFACCEFHRANVTRLAGTLSPYDA